MKLSIQVTDNCQTKLFKTQVEILFFINISTLSFSPLSSDLALLPQPNNNNYYYNSVNMQALKALETKGQLAEQSTRPVAGEILFLKN